MPAALALLSALLWGIGDFLGGLVSRRATPLQTSALSTPAGFLLLLPIGFLVGGDAAGSWLPGVLAGAVGGIAILLLYQALSLGPMGVVSPISAVLGAGIPVLFGLLRGERPGLAAYVGMGLAVVAIVTVGLEPAAPTDDSTHQRVTPKALGLSIAAGVGIGTFFTLIALAPKDAGLWPMVFARGTSTVVVLAVGLVVVLRMRGLPVDPEQPGRGRLLPTGRTLRAQAVSAGVFDVGANAFYLVAVQTGLLSVVAVLGSLYPAATVLLARYVLAERLRPMQKVGMVTALAAAALLALPTPA